jgi:hypothetical protein
MLVTLDPQLTFVSAELTIGESQGAGIAKPKVQGSQYTWNLTLQADQSATLIVMAKADVKSLFYKFTTTEEHQDGVNPANDVTIPMVTQSINYFFPIQNK